MHLTHIDHDDLFATAPCLYHVLQRPPSQAPRHAAQEQPADIHRIPHCDSSPPVSRICTATHLPTPHPPTPIRLNSGIRPHPLHHHNNVRHHRISLVTNTKRLHTVHVRLLDPRSRPRPHQSPLVPRKSRHRNIATTPRRFAEIELPYARPSHVTLLSHLPNTIANVFAHSHRNSPRLLRPLRPLPMAPHHLAFLNAQPTSPSHPVPSPRHPPRDPSNAFTQSPLTSHQPHIFVSSSPRALHRLSLTPNGFVRLPPPSILLGYINNCVIHTHVLHSHVVMVSQSPLSTADRSHLMALPTRSLSKSLSTMHSTMTYTFLRSKNTRSLSDLTPYATSLRMPHGTSFMPQRTPSMEPSSAASDSSLAPLPTSTRPV